MSGISNNPNQDGFDRMETMLEPTDICLHSLNFTRGTYDVGGACDASDCGTVFALKTAVMRGGTMAATDALEVFDSNVYANNTAPVSGTYTPPEG